VLEIALVPPTESPSDQIANAKHFWKDYLDGSSGYLKICDCVKFVRRLQPGA
jgi:hypothetical protein